MIYENIKKNTNQILTKFVINFVDGPYLEIKSGDSSEFRADFINQSTGNIEYSVNLKDGHWGKASKKYFVDWNIKIYKEDSLVYDYKYNCKGKRVYIALDSKSMGDTLAWFPYAEEFRKKHGCHVIVSTFNNDWFKDQYPNLEFVKPGEVVHNLYAMYKIGWFYQGNSEEIDLYKNVSDFKKIPLQQTASDILGLEAIETRPLLSLKDNVAKKKKVSIAIHSTSQAKYWNNPNGWQEVVDYLVSKDYEVVLLSREGNGYMGNFHPTGIRQLEPGPIENVINELQESEAFIGIGSGLSWLSWATNIPTILISGFSAPYSEVQDNVYRIIPPKGSCSSCYNHFKLDASNWNWCPDRKKYTDFECSKSIPSIEVIEKLKTILN
jgi:autotransporter strand-loop-strand O-heptosyltransferase